LDHHNSPIRRCHETLSVAAKIVSLHNIIATYCTSFFPGDVPHKSHWIRIAALLLIHHHHSKREIHQSRSNHWKQCDIMRIECKLMAHEYIEEYIENNIRQENLQLRPLALAKFRRFLSVARLQSRCRSSVWRDRHPCQEQSNDSIYNFSDVKHTFHIISIRVNVSVSVARMSKDVPLKYSNVTPIIVALSRL
jgi:hypothetical protein